MKPYIKPSQKGLIVVLSIFTVLSFGYHNCARSRISVQDLRVSGFASSVKDGTAAVTVGTSDVADLKMMFVVDNSYTMTQNNVNLTRSFPTLFNTENSSNLSPFEMTSYMFTVAQRTPTITYADQSRLLGLKSWLVDPAQVPQAQRMGWRSPANIGKLQGDSVGFSVASPDLGKSFQFSLSPVVGIDANGNIQTPLVKAKAESSENLVNDFSTRLNYIQQVSASGNYSINQDILDQESGLCAVARILRNPENYMKAGDLAVINVFTDEDDADASGQNCILSEAKVDGTDDLYDVSCNTKQTRLTYQVNTPVPAKCLLGYEAAFNYSMNYRKLLYTSSVSYDYISNYSCPVTDIGYTTASAWQKKVTSVALTFKTFRVLDGVKVFDPGTQTKNFQVDGYQSANCAALAQASLNSANQQLDGQNCSESLIATSSCDFRNSNCVPVSLVSASKQITGDYSTSQASCDSAASANISVYDFTKPFSCHLNGAQANSSSSKPGCMMQLTHTTVSNINKDLSTVTSCNNEAIARGAYVSATTQPTCTSPSSLVDQPVTGSLSLSAGSTLAGPYPVACSSQIQASILAARSLAANTTVTACSVTGVPTSQTTQDLKTGSTCVQQAADLCASSSNYRNCSVLSSTPATVGVGNATWDLAEDVTCLSLCKDSKTGACGNSGYSNTTTLQDYLVSSKGSLSCSQAAPVTNTFANYSARTNSQLTGLCPTTYNGAPVNQVITRGPYHTNGVAVDYVSGTDTSTSPMKPAQDLVSFITQKSNSYFNANSPIVNIFIRTAQDPLGENGSRGLAYEKLAAQMNGEVFSVLSSDYSPAFSKIGNIVKSRIMRTFKVAGMALGQRVTKVTRWSSLDKSTTVLDSSQWSFAGTSITINDSVNLQINDELLIEFQ